MAGVRSSIDATLIGVTEGHWCRDCRLPSGARFIFVTSIGQSLRGVTSALRCRDCGGDHIDPA